MFQRLADELQDPELVATPLGGHGYPTVRIPDGRHPGPSVLHRFGGMAARPEAGGGMKAHPSSSPHVHHVGGDGPSVLHRFGGMAARPEAGGDMSAPRQEPSSAAKTGGEGGDPMTQLLAKQLEMQRELHELRTAAAEREAKEARADSVRQAETMQQELRRQTEAMRVGMEEFQQELWDKVEQQQSGSRQSLVAECDRRQGLGATQRETTAAQWFSQGRGGSSMLGDRSFQSARSGMGTLDPKVFRPDKFAEQTSDPFFAQEWLKRFETYAKFTLEDRKDWGEALSSGFIKSETTGARWARAPGVQRIIRDWGQFRMEFLRRFTPPDTLRRTFKDFEEFQMSAKGEKKYLGVKVHNDGFLEKMDRTLHAMDQSLTPGMEGFMMHRYLESLTPGIRASVILATATLSTPTLQDLMTVAVQVNPGAATLSLREEAESKFSTAEVNAHFEGRSEHFQGISQGQFRTRKLGLRCFACNSPDHLVSKCNRSEGIAWRECWEKRQRVAGKERSEGGSQRYRQSGGPPGAGQKSSPHGRVQAKKVVAFREPVAEQRTAPPGTVHTNTTSDTPLGGTPKLQQGISVSGRTSQTMDHKDKNDNTEAVRLRGTAAATSLSGESGLGPTTFCGGAAVPRVQLPVQGARGRWMWIKVLLDSRASHSFLPPNVLAEHRSPPWGDAHSGGCVVPHTRRPSWRRSHGQRRCEQLHSGVRR